MKFSVTCIHVGVDKLNSADIRFVDGVVMDFIEFTDVSAGMVFRCPKCKREVVVSFG